MGSSDEGSLLQAFDDDEEDAPQPMEHVVKWKAIRDQAITVTGTTVYIPQSIYQPYTEADRVRYIEKADLKEPIIFKTTHPDQWGIPLDDALRAKMKNLLDKDDSMFENCGPSVSIRLQWPGYRAWTKQIPTMDFKSPKGPITRAKLAKNIANCVKRFIDEKEKERMEMEADRRWRVGTRYIRMEDLILVSLHHISKGSWQPQLRLRTPLNEIHTRRLQVQAQAPQSIA
jgi:nitrogen fixation protein